MDARGQPQWDNPVMPDTDTAIHRRLPRHRTKREGGKETTMTDYDNFGEPWLLDRTPASGDAYDPALDREHA